MNNANYREPRDISLAMREKPDNINVLLNWVSYTPGNTWLDASVLAKFNWFLASETAANDPYFRDEIGRRLDRCKLVQQSSPDNMPYINNVVALAIPNREAKVVARMTPKVIKTMTASDIAA